MRFLAFFIVFLEKKNATLLSSNVKVQRPRIFCILLDNVFCLLKRVLLSETPALFCYINNGDQYVIITKHFALI